MSQSFILVAILVAQAHRSTPVGNIAGTVQDASTRSALVGANIVVVGTEFGAAADAAGRFIISNLPAGTYSVEATMIGYQAQAKTSIVVSPDRTTELLFRLERSAITMPGVKVTADYFPKVKDAPVSERTFSSDEIQVQTGGMGDIQRVVQALPAVVSSGDQDNEIIVRGGNPGENLFLIDGIEIPFPNHFGAPTQQGGPISMLNALLIREVDFIAGAFPARYGDRASSVLDISLKHGSETEIAGNIDIGMAGLGVILEGPLASYGSFLGSYHKSFLELMARSGVWGLTSVPYYDNALGKLSIRPRPGHEVTLLGLWGSDHIVIEPGANVTEQSQWTRFRSDRYIFGAGWQTLFGDLGYGKLLLSTASTGWHATLAADSLFGDTLVRQHSVEQSLTGRYDLTFRWHQNHETQAGFSLSRTPFNYDVWLWPDTIFYYLYDSAGMVLDSFPLLDSLGRPVVRGFSSAGNFHGLKLAGYLQHRLGIFNIAHLTIGLRSDHFTYTDHFYFSPRLGIVTNPLFAGFSLNLGYGIHYQPPQFYILAYDSAANRRLHSRRSDHYIIGIERLFGSEAKLSVEGYYKRLSHLPIPKSWTTPDPYDLSGTYLDIGRGTAQGVELFLQKKFTHNWNATIAYSYSQSRITNPRDTTRTVPGEFDYRHLLTTTATYRVPFHTYQWYQRLPGWFRATIGGVIFSDEADFGLRFRYAGGRPYTPMTWLPETRTWAENGDSIYAARYPDYLRLDLRWSHKFLYRKWSLSWYLDIQNVLDRQNIWFYDYQSDGNIEPVYQLRFWPVAGMIIEF